MTTAIDVLPEPVQRRGITEPQWRTLANNLYPGADPKSVLMVWDYCIARKLDPMKKPCHIVPMEVKDAKTGAYGWRDVVMPGIYEHRTTATRTGVYLGHSAPDYGPLVPEMGVVAPEWCAMTIYRWNEFGKMRAEFPVRVFFREVVAVTKDRKSGEWKANARWSKAPVQMLTKCTEAAGLREAFPDEIGGEQTAEEMDGQRAIDAVVSTVPEKPAPPKPDGYDDWLDMFTRMSNGVGFDAFAAAWAKAPQPYRAHLMLTAPDRYESMRASAEVVDEIGPEGPTS